MIRRIETLVDVETKQAASLKTLPGLRPDEQPVIRPLVSGYDRIDELVGIVGLVPALAALRGLALLEHQPSPTKFVDDPTKRLQEVEVALREQNDLIARAQIR